MPKSSAVATASGMLSDLKSRLGFSHSDGEYDDADFGEYDDFDDEGFNERDDREFAGYGADYDESVPVGGFQPATAHSSRFGRADSAPNLVSIDDVKAHTQSREYQRDTGSTASASRSGRIISGRNLIDERAPAESSPAYNASLRDRNRDSSSRSSGVNSLFEPTSSSSRRVDAGTSYDPYLAYSGTGSSTYTSTRRLTVVKPVSYGDAERVSRALKAGDVAVLVMRSTSDDLSKRLLDFSFGAASALDANVECPAEKVFAIARGDALTEEEKRELRNQGVL